MASPSALAKVLPGGIIFLGVSDREVRELLRQLFLLKNLCSQAPPQQRSAIKQQTIRQDELRIEPPCLLFSTSSLSGKLGVPRRFLLRNNDATPSPRRASRLTGKYGHE